MLSSENQNTEYKRTWSDEYLKWICGFANAQGGRIYIGVADDRTVIGLTDTELHRLSEDIPNKVRDVLGIIVDVNTQNDNGKQYIEIESWNQAAFLSTIMVNTTTVAVLPNRN